MGYGLNLSVANKKKAKRFVVVETDKSGRKNQYLRKWQWR